MRRVFNLLVSLLMGLISIVLYAVAGVFWLIAAGIGLVRIIAGLTLATGLKDAGPALSLMPSCLAHPSVARRLPRQGSTPLRFAAQLPLPSAPLCVLSRCANLVRKEDNMEGNFFEWGRLVMMAGQFLVSGGGLIAILVGLARMKEAGTRRDREIDVMAENMQENARIIAQALERQGAALERQGAMMTEALQGLRQQGEVLAALLRRGA